MSPNAPYSPGNSTLKGVIGLVVLITWPIWWPIRWAWRKWSEGQ